MLNLADQITLFRSLFHGRADVFAIYWEKGSKHGYMPAYDFDPYHFRQHKVSGGTFQNYQDKHYLSLNDAQIAKHLEGGQLIGIYPLLQDNSTWFLAADFDKQDWDFESRSFLQICWKNRIPAYLERSRSGNGGHVWIFFEQPYLAHRSRAVFISLLEQSGAISIFNKSSSFDRLFPNQDRHSGKGLGNLIALPLYKPALDKGNSCFVDPDTIEPYPDQWAFLQNIQRVKVSTLEHIYESIHTIKSTQDVQNASFSSKKVTITLENEVQISRAGIPLMLINFLKEEFNIANSAFFIQKNSGKNTWDTDRYFKMIRETEQAVIVPRGSIGMVIRFCRVKQLDYELLDRRKRLMPVEFKWNAQLREYQKPAVEAATKKDFGVIVAPPGSGKTIMGLKIIADKQQPALIIVHRKHLAEQWIERIQAFLGIPKNEIGEIRQGKRKIGKQITVAIVQSLEKALANLEKQDFISTFGTILIDECQHVPAETFQRTISQLPTYYLYGLTATPFRKHNDGKLIFIHLGDIIATINSKDISLRRAAKIVIQETSLDIPFNAKTDKFETLSKALIQDSARNKIILADIQKEMNLGKKAVIITERKEHIDALLQYLKQDFEVVTLSGDDASSVQASKWKILRAGNFQVLITTGQFFGEGTDLPNISCLFLVYPFSFEGKLVQYVGRVQRGEITPIIYDYHDRKIDYLHRLFLKRNAWYRKIEQQATLFDDPEDLEPSLPKDEVLVLKEKVKILIADLDFQYGCVSFKYWFEQARMELQFEIGHLFIRPEFEVLKPYFIKSLGSKYIHADLFAEIQKGDVLSQLASSEELTEINQDMIESVRFRFVEKEMLGKHITPRQHELVEMNQMQGDPKHQAVGFLYESGEALLEDILKNATVKHFSQLRFLADRHERSILKLRFVLSPFSFVFLVAGTEQYHIVFETLDTEEATYIWHLPKDKKQLPESLRQVNDALNIIRQQGRHYFLSTHPAGFSKILHDYSNDRKGFIVWRDYLEERLI